MKMKDAIQTSNILFKLTIKDIDYLAGLLGLDVGHYMTKREQVVGLTVELHKNIGFSDREKTIYFPCN